VNDDTTDPRQPIYDVLDALRRDYERAAAPWLKMLADYESHQPPRPILVRADPRCPATLGNAGQCWKPSGHEGQHSLVDWSATPSPPAPAQPEVE